jgi:hypothetical protein
MPLIDLTIQHGRTLDEARHHLETAVQEVSRRLATLVRRVHWTPGRDRVKLEGTGFWVEMWVDAQAVRVTGDVPILGALLGGQLASTVKQIVQQTFQKQLP